METYIKVKHSIAAGIAVTAVVFIITLTNQSWALPAGPHHAFLTGPWELVVKIGRQGEALRFPVEVLDENKPHKLDSTLPIMGTPIKIKLEQYVPDLKWETTIVNHPGGGIVAKLKVKRKDSEQQMWLSSSDPFRQSISSEIGGIAMRRLYDPNSVKKLLRQLTHPEAVGILSVWPESANSPVEYVVRPTETTTISVSEYKLSIQDYIPHYSIDTKTKKVISLSDKPVNPAIKVSLSDGENTYGQWLWAKFPTFSHSKIELPLRMRFTDFNLRGTKGKYILVVVPKSEPWLLFSEKGQTRVEKAVLGRAYPFADKQYSFIIEKILDDAILKTDWKNNSENLLHPAIIATIEQNGISQQAVLEFGKPYHQRTKFGTMVLLYRRRPKASKASD